MKKFLLVIVILLFLVVGAGVCLAISLTADMTVDEPIAITVPEGSGSATIANILEENGLVHKAEVFRLFSRYYGVDSQFKAGEYSFAAGKWSLAAICDQLVVGGHSEGNTLWITVVEGLTADEIFTALADAGAGDYNAFLDYSQNGDFSKYDFIPSADQVVAPANRLEGYLFPDTYQIDASWTEEQIIDMLLDQFVRVWTDNGFDQMAEAQGKTIHDVITMAAIIEKEALLASDRPIISGVFYKRLQEGWPLESCATVQFLIPEHRKVLLYSDLEIDSPYNTYKYTGMTPGPIAAPGLSSIRAALEPEDSDYWYFCARTDGSTRFSKTLSEHQTYHDGDLVE